MGGMFRGGNNRGGTFRGEYSGHLYIGISEGKWPFVFIWNKKINILEISNYFEHFFLIRTKTVGEACLDINFYI